MQRLLPLREDDRGSGRGSRWSLARDKIDKRGEENDLEEVIEFSEVGL